MCLAKRKNYRHGGRRPMYASIERNIADTIIARVSSNGGDAQRLGRRRRQNYVLINGELIVSIHLAYTRYRNSAGAPRFMLRAGAPIRSDIAILVPFNGTGQRVRDYYALPRFLLTTTQQYIFDFNPIEIEAFRSDTLEPLLDFLKRQDMANVPLGLAIRAARTRFPSLKPLRFTARAERRRPGRMLRSFERISHRVASFTAQCKHFTEAQFALHQDLLILLNDPTVRKILQDEGLRSIPLPLYEWLTHGRLERVRRLGTSAPNMIPPLQECGYRLTPERSNRIHNMRVAFADPSRAFAELLIAASTPDDFIVRPQQRSFLSRSDVAHIQMRFRPIEDAAYSMLAGFEERALCYALARAFTRSLLNNVQVADYIRTVHPKSYHRLILTPLSPGPLR